MAVSDVLLIAVILLTFSYFHHVRAMWGLDGGNKVIGSFAGSGEEPGKAVSEMFLQGDDESVVSLQSDGEIRAYAKAQGFPLYDKEESLYLALYRSQNIYMTVREVNTELYRAATKKSYTVRFYHYDVYVKSVENLFTQTLNSAVSFEKLVGDAEAFSKNPVIGAVNGDYTSNKNHCLVAVRNGDLLRQSEFIESDIGVLFYDGTMETFTPSTYDWLYISERQPYQIWNFGPSLLDEEGNPRTTFDNNAYDSNVLGAKHPRTAIGYHEPGHYALVVADGRKDGISGMYIDVLAGLMHDLGCVVAYNMDGGDSSQAYLNGELIRTAERDEQRKLSDIICVGERS